MRQLLVKYIDGNVRDEQGKVNHPPYPQAWYRRIAEDTGQHLQIPAGPEQKPAVTPAVVPAAEPAQKAEPKPTVAPAP